MASYDAEPNENNRVKSLLSSQTKNEAASAADAVNPSSGDKTRNRFGEAQKFLPICFMLVTIFVLWYLYVFFHSVPLIRLGGHNYGRLRGLTQLVVFHYLLGILLVCYVQSILVHPGAVPDNDPQWEYTPSDGSAPSDWVGTSVQELKKTGERRHCKWCGKYKPDRCHHCRVCRMCILKMDHHCPWIYNCVGFHNYKHFFLLLFYCVCILHLIVWTMLESVRRCIELEDTPFQTMFFTFFGETLAFFFCVLITTFFGFHVYLVCRAMTTIEFCEKSLSQDGTPPNKSIINCDPSVYDSGIFANLQTVLGDNVLLWAFPCSTGRGDGLTYTRDEATLTNVMEQGRSVRRREHQIAQRGPLIRPSQDRRHERERR